MSRKEEYVEKLITFTECDNYQGLEEYLLINSNIPGPRANLELAYAVSDVINQIKNGIILYEKCIDWIYEYENVETNDELEYLPFIGTIVLGAYYEKMNEIQKEGFLFLIYKAINNHRWRMQDSAVISLQLLGEKNIENLRKYISKLLQNGSFLEKKTVVATLAYPPILNEELAIYALDITRDIFKEIIELKAEDLKTSDVTLLIKSLDFVISFFVLKVPKEGFEFLKEYINSNSSEIVKIIKENLQKNRLIKAYPREVNSVSKMIII